MHFGKFKKDKHHLTGDCQFFVITPVGCKGLAGLIQVAKFVSTKRCGSQTARMHGEQ